MRLRLSCLRPTAKQFSWILCFACVAALFLAEASAALADGMVVNREIFSDDEPTMILQDGAGEGPAWHAEHGLFFSGPKGITNLSIDGKATLFLADAGSNGLLFDAQRQLLICQPKFRRVSRMNVRRGN